jgi:hypothetical protein
LLKNAVFVKWLSLTGSAAHAGQQLVSLMHSAQNVCPQLVRKRTVMELEELEEEEDEEEAQELQWSQKGRRELKDLDVELAILVRFVNFGILVNRMAQILIDSHGSRAKFPGVATFPRSDLNCARDIIQTVRAK